MPILWMKSLGVTTQNVSVSLTVTVLWDVCFSVFYGKKKSIFALDLILGTLNCFACFC